MSINPYAIAQPPPDEMDLFGDEADAITHPSTSAAKPTTSLTPSVDEHTGLTDEDDVEDMRRRRRLEYGEDEGEPPQVQKVTATNHTLQNLGVPRSSDGNYWDLRLPPYVWADSRPFHPDTFQSIEPKETVPGSEAKNSLLIKMELANTIRWRWVKAADGSMVKQSNARVVKWNDGTMSLQLGKEMYDIVTDIEHPPSSTPSQSQSQSFSQGSKSISRNKGISYIVTQHPYETLLQAEVAITGSMKLQPVGMESEVHRQLVRAVTQKHSKVSKLRFASDSMLAAAEQAQEALKKAPGARSRTGILGDGGSGKKRRISAYDKRRKRRMGGYSDDEDDSGQEGDDLLRHMGNVKGIGEYQEDEFLVADADEGDNYGTRRKTPKKKVAEDDGLDDMDALEEAEEKLERMAKRRGQDDMDLDDDDDDEEAQNAIRRSFGKRKKGVSLIEDSDQE